MDTPLRFSDLARMVAAQFCFIVATGPAVFAGILVRDRLEADIVTAMGAVIALSATSTGIGTLLLSRCTRHGVLAAAGCFAALCTGLYSVHLLSNLLDWPVG